MASGPQNTSSNAGPAHDQSPPTSPVTWDGDRMFNIYIYDYCLKRGYQKTARELLAEADIPAESQPPINAKQGLLFEWWSVFWVLFTAKSSGQGSDDALLYVSHQHQQNAQRQAQNRIPQQPANRFPPNGMPRPAGMPPTGPLTNGVPNPGPPPGQPPMPNGAGPMGQPPMQPGMRPGPGGPQQLPPQRAPNGGPFQSPTMAHSPQQSGIPPGTLSNQPGGGVPGMVGTQPPLTQMNRGNMPPPGAPGPMGGGPPPMMAGQTPQQGFSQLGSQPGSPATQGSMSAPSPSMAHRQPPGGQQQQDPALAQVSELNKELSHLNNAVLASLRQELLLGDKDHLSLSVDEKRRIVELARAKGRLPPQNRQVQGPPIAGAPSGQHMQPMTPQQRAMQMGHPPQPPQPPQGPPGQIPNRPKRSSTSPGEEHGQLPKNESSPPANKRQRTSPGGPAGPGQLSQQQQPGPSGPPPQQQQPPPMASMLPSYSQHPPQPGGPGGPHGMSNGMMNRPMSNMPFPGQPGMPGMGNSPGNQGMQVMPGIPQMGGPQMGGMNSPGLMHPGAPGMNPQSMNSMQAQMQYRQVMHNMHKAGISSNNAGSPPSDVQQFNSDGPHSRPGTGMSGVPGMPGHYPQGPMGGPGNPNAPSRPQHPGQPGKPMLGGMMPPPSPGPKHVPGPDNKGPGLNLGDGLNPGASPRNLGMGQPPPPGMPPNVGPSHPPQQQQQQQHSGTAPHTPIPSNSITAPSPPPSMVNQLGGGSHTTQELFGTDFMNSVSGSLDDFEFRPDATMDFERDFGEWFAPAEQNGIEGKL